MTDKTRGRHFEDLTKIDVPFEELDQATQWALKGAFGEDAALQFFGRISSEWVEVAIPHWMPDITYRLKPTPVEETITHDMQISVHGPNMLPSVSTGGQTGSGWINGTFTIETLDSKAVSATWVPK